MAWITNSKPDFIYHSPRRIAIFCDGSAHDHPDQRRQDQITVHLWDATDKVGQSLKELEEEFNSVALSPFGEHIVSQANDKTVRLWDSLLEEFTSGSL